MRRRSVLGAVSAASAVMFAGCTGNRAGGGSGTGTSTVRSPELVGRAFRVRGASCGSREDEAAAVSFGESGVVVRGTVVGANGCYRARLASASYDREADVCRVVVAAFDAGGPNEVCTQCLTAVSYEAELGFEGGRPGRVEVVHDDLGGRSVVATASP